MVIADTPFSFRLPNSDPSAMADHPVSMHSLSPRLVAMISEYLEGGDLFNLPLSCRYFRECSFSLLIERYFHTRVHMLTLRSLETLLEISRHPVFVPSIRTLVISANPVRDVVSGKPVGDDDNDDTESNEQSPKPPTSIPAIRESNRQYIEELGFLEACGVITGYLTQILGKAVGCRTVTFGAICRMPWGYAARGSPEHAARVRRLTTETVPSHKAAYMIE